MKSYDFEKDPDATLDYAKDWALWLGTDTIVSSAWSIPSPMSLVSQSNTSTVATVWVSGGVAGVYYTLRNRITTAGGRTDDRSIVLWCHNR